MEDSNERTYKMKAAKPAQMAPSSNGCLDQPSPEIVFQGRSFCFTGVFDFANGNRNECEAATKARGGFCYERPNKSLNYLVVGSHAEPSWSHGNFGRKIIAVLGFKEAGAKCQIVSEAHWVKALEKAPEQTQNVETPVQSRTKTGLMLQLQNDLDAAKKDRQLIFDVLQEELSSGDYQKIVERLKKAGLVV